MAFEKTDWLARVVFGKRGGRKDARISTKKTDFRGFTGKENGMTGKGTKRPETAIF